jgi:hypothetical protein
MPADRSDQVEDLAMPAFSGQVEAESCRPVRRRQLSEPTSAVERLELVASAAAAAIGAELVTTAPAGSRSPSSSSSRPRRYPHRAPRIARR